MLLLFLLPSALFLVGLMGADSAAGANATVSIAPASQTVDQGAALSVDVKQNATVAVSGIQVDFNFNPGLLQIVSVTKGTAYDGASFLMGVAPQTKDEAIAEANTTGTLQNVASYFLPGTGQVPAGDATFITVAMQAKNAGGTSEISLTGIEMFDTNANAVTVTPNTGTVNVNGATATASPIPCQQCSPTPTATARPVTPTPTPAPPLEAFLTVTPNSTLAPPGAEFPITITQQSNRISTGAQTDIKFDPSVIQIVSVARGQAYQRAFLIMGVVPPAPATPLPNAETIAQANGSGTLKNVATFFAPGSGSVQPGEAAFLTVKLKALTDGRSPITLANMEIIDDQGNSVGVGANNGEIVVRTGAPLPGQQALGASRLPAGGSASDSSGEGIVIVGLALTLAGAIAGGVVLRRVVRRK